VDYWKYISYGQINAMRGAGKFLPKLFDLALKAGAIFAGEYVDLTNQNLAARSA
jgi:hypothetical protein